MSPPAGERRYGFTLRELMAYFLRLGSSGFGGPIALVGYMQRDLVESEAGSPKRSTARDWLWLRRCPARSPRSWRCGSGSSAPGHSAPLLLRCRSSSRRACWSPRSLSSTPIPGAASGARDLPRRWPRRARDHRDRRLQTRAHDQQDRPSAVGHRRRCLRGHGDREDRDRVAVPRRRRIRDPLLRRRHPTLATEWSDKRLTRRAARRGEGLRVVGIHVRGHDELVLRQGERVHVRLRLGDRPVPTPGPRSRPIIG